MRNSKPETLISEALTMYSELGFDVIPLVQGERTITSWLAEPCNLSIMARCPCKFQYLLARLERRDTRGQAAILVRHELTRRGLLTVSQVESLAPVEDLKQDGANVSA